MGPLIVSAFKERWQSCLVPVINDAEPVLVKISCIWNRGKISAHRPSSLRWLPTYPVKMAGLTGHVEIEAYKTGPCSAYLLSCISEDAYHSSLFERSSVMSSTTCKYPVVVVSCLLSEFSGPYLDWADLNRNNCCCTVPVNIVLPLRSDQSGLTASAVSNNISTFYPHGLCEPSVDVGMISRLRGSNCWWYVPIHV